MINFLKNWYKIKVAEAELIEYKLEPTATKRGLDERLAHLEELRKEL